MHWCQLRKERTRKRGTNALSKDSGFFVFHDGQSEPRAWELPKELAGGPTSLVETWRRFTACNTMQKRRKEYLSMPSRSRKKGVIWRPTGALVAADR